jgi:hypothetical protein
MELEGKLMCSSTENKFKPHKFREIIKLNEADQQDIIKLKKNLSALPSHNITKVIRKFQNFQLNIPFGFRITSYITANFTTC